MAKQEYMKGPNWPEGGLAQIRQEAAVRNAQVALAKEGVVVLPVPTPEELAEQMELKKATGGSGRRMGW